MLEGTGVEISIGKENACNSVIMSWRTTKMSIGLTVTTHNARDKGSISAAIH